MLSMTYGVMPTRKDFDQAWDNSIAGESLTFNFRNDSRLGDNNLTNNELWLELNSARAEYEKGDEKSGEWCSAVLYILGFEWI